MKILLGKKIGMTRVFDEEGRSFAVTAVEAMPLIVSQLKTTEKDGYNAVQLKALNNKEKELKKFEIRVENPADYKVGDKISVDFLSGDVVEVTGTGKGKGFAGTIKRHGFHRGPETHGSNNVREPGSIGAQQPQRVTLGRRMAGRMGGETITIKNLKIVDVKENILLVRGAIPGPAKSLVKVISK